MDWTTPMAEQLDWHWQAHARPRLEGLTDAEYFWEPVEGCWSIRPREQATSSPIGAGEFVIDYAFPEPTPAPVTTIAWRLAHIIIGVLGERNARYFDGPAMSYADFDYPSTADRALEVLDECYVRWNSGVRALGDAGLAERCREHGFEESSMAELVLHINREMIHHLAEIALLRDLYAWTAPERSE